MSNNVRNIMSIEADNHSEYWNAMMDDFDFGKSFEIIAPVPKTVKITDHGLSDIIPAMLNALSGVKYGIIKSEYSEKELTGAYKAYVGAQYGEYLSSKQVQNFLEASYDAVTKEKISADAFKWYHDYKALKASNSKFAESLTLEYEKELLESVIEDDESSLLTKYLTFCLALLENIIQHNAATEHDWCKRYWGTKWHPYDVDDVEYEKGGKPVLKFSTANKTPKAFFRKLSSKYRDVKIKIKYADESIGSSNCGEMIYQNGEIIEYKTYADTISAIKFACKVWDLDYNEYISG